MIDRRGATQKRNKKGQTQAEEIAKQYPKYKRKKTRMTRMKKGG